MLLMEPDVAGGYVHRVLGAQNVPHLYVKRGDDDYRRACQFYDAVRARAFSVRGVKRGADVVRAWLGHTGTGTWQPHWLAHVETRPPEYFSEYDNNIRCWVPAYDQLIQQTGDIVCHLLLERLRRTAAPLALLELGCGTGALTEVLARWVEQIDAPHRNVRRPSVVDRLVALDPATPMRAETSRRIEGAFKGTPPFLHVSHGRAPDSFPSTVDDRRYDVICGSLVLHDVLAGRSDERVVDAVAKLARRLTPGGSLVFADVFPDDRPDARREQMAEWARWMEESAGLSKDAVQAFLDANRDMTGAVSADALRRAARRCSDQVVESANEEARGAPGGCPFRVVALTFPAQVV
jgi:SAM-dependent methyltransferase